MSLHLSASFERSGRIKIDETETRETSEYKNNNYTFPPEFTSDSTEILRVRSPFVIEIEPIKKEKR